MSISPNLRFHLDGLDCRVEAWEKLNIVFGLKNEIQHFYIEIQLLTVDPGNFPSIEDYLSKFKTLRLLLASCKVTKEGEPFIYGILSKLPPPYFVFVSTFHSTREALISIGAKYRCPYLHAFYDSLIREQENILHLGLIKTANNSNKSLVSQQSQGSKNLKKRHPKKNGPKHDKASRPNEKVAQHNDKANKNKGNKTYINCNFCDRDGHIQSKFFKKMETLEVAMKRHSIHLDTSSTSSLGQALSTYIYAPSISGYALNVTSYSPSQEWLIDSGASYHMGKDKDVFSALNNFNTKNVFLGDDRYLSVEGSRTVHLNNGRFKDVLCLPNLPCNLLSMCQITHLGEGKSVLFTPHQVVIRDLKYPRHVLATGSVDDITRLYNLTMLGHPLFHQYLLLIVMM